LCVVSTFLVMLIYLLLSDSNSSAHSHTAGISIDDPRFHLNAIGLGLLPSSSGLHSHGMAVGMYPHPPHLTPPVPVLGAGIAGDSDQYGSSASSNLWRSPNVAADAVGAAASPLSAALYGLDAVAMASPGHSNHALAPVTTGAQPHHDSRLNRHGSTVPAPLSSSSVQPMHQSQRSSLSSTRRLSQQGTGLSPTQEPQSAAAKPIVVCMGAGAGAVNLTSVTADASMISTAVRVKAAPGMMVSCVCSCAGITCMCVCLPLLSTHFITQSSIGTLPHLNVTV